MIIAVNTLLVIVGLVVAGMLAHMLYRPRAWSLRRIAVLFGAAGVWIWIAFTLELS